MLYFHYFSCPWPAQVAFWLPFNSPFRYSSTALSAEPVTLGNSTHSAMFVAWSPMRSKYLAIIKMSIEYSPESGFWWIMLIMPIHYLRNIHCFRSFYLEFIHFWRQILHINKEIVHFIYIHKNSIAPQCGRPHNNWLYRKPAWPVCRLWSFVMWFIFPYTSVIQFFLIFPVLLPHLV